MEDNCRFEKRTHHHRSLQYKATFELDQHEKQSWSGNIQIKKQRRHDLHWQKRKLHADNVANRPIDEDDEKEDNPDDDDDGHTCAETETETINNHIHQFLSVEDTKESISKLHDILIEIEACITISHNLSQWIQPIFIQKLLSLLQQYVQLPVQIFEYFPLIIVILEIVVTLTLIEDIHLLQHFMGFVSSAYQMLKYLPVIQEQYQKNLPPTLQYESTQLILSILCNLYSDMDSEHHFANTIKTNCQIIPLCMQQCFTHLLTCYPNYRAITNSGEQPKQPKPKKQCLIKFTSGTTTIVPHNESTESLYLYYEVIFKMLQHNDMLLAQELLPKYQGNVIQFFQSLILTMGLIILPQQQKKQMKRQQGLDNEKENNDDEEEASTQQQQQDQQQLMLFELLIWLANQSCIHEYFFKLMIVCPIIHPHQKVGLLPLLLNLTHQNHNNNNTMLTNAELSRILSALCTTLNPEFISELLKPEYAQFWKHALHLMDVPNPMLFTPSYTYFSDNHLAFNTYIQHTCLALANLVTCPTNTDPIQFVLQYQLFNPILTLYWKLPHRIVQTEILHFIHGLIRYADSNQFDNMISKNDNIINIPIYVLNHLFLHDATDVLTFNITFNIIDDLLKRNFAHFKEMLETNGVESLLQERGLGHFDPSIQQRSEGLLESVFRVGFNDNDLPSID